MKIETNIMLEEFTESMAGQPFFWGWNDCNTLALEWLDRLQDANDLDNLLIALGQYDSEKTAREFQERYGLTIYDVLLKAGAEIVETGPLPGDIILVQYPDEPWYRAGICLPDDRVLTVDPRLGTIKIPREYMPNPGIIMRYG